MPSVLLTLACSSAPAPDTPSPGAEVAALREAPAGPEGAPAPEAAPLTVEPPPAALVHVSEAGGKPATVRVGADGSVTPLASLPSGGVFPGASDPLGTHALVVMAEDAEEGGHREALGLVPLAGGEVKPLTPWATKVRNPAWGPDGTWIVFESDAASFRDLFRVARSGGDPVRLTEAKHGSFEPAVSADGAHIAMGTSRDGNAEIYVMNADGSEPRRITEHPSDDVRPAFGPDGTLAWIAHRDGVPRVWVTDPAAPDTARPLRPPEGKVLHLDAAWSPDGTRIAVTVQTGPQALDVQVIEVASGRIVATHGGEGVDEHPAWSPDGRWLAWSHSAGEDSDVHVAEANGGPPKRVTGEGADWLPRWVVTK